MKKMLLTLAALFAAATTALAANYDIGTLEELREFMEAVHVDDFAAAPRVRRWWRARFQQLLRPFSRAQENAGTTG